MQISNTFLFLDPTRVTLHKMQFRIIFIYHIIGLCAALFVTETSYFSSPPFKSTFVRLAGTCVGLLCSRPLDRP